jgi:hypothetical protein
MRSWSAPSPTMQRTTWMCLLLLKRSFSSYWMIGPVIWFG